MSFTLIDWFVGLILAGSMTHLTAFSTRSPFPSVFGYGAGANLVHGLLLAAVAVDIYIFTYGLSAAMNNSLLLGAADMLILYAVVGRFILNRVQKKNDHNYRAQTT